MYVRIHGEACRDDKGRDDCITVLAENKNAAAGAGVDFVGYYQDSGERTSDGLLGVGAEGEGMVPAHFCAADQRVSRDVLSVDTDFTSGGILQRAAKRADTFDTIYKRSDWGGDEHHKVAFY